MLHFVKKSISNYIVRSDIANVKSPNPIPTIPGGKCRKTCNLINTNTILTNNYNGRRVRINSGGNCKTKIFSMLQDAKNMNLFILVKLEKNLENVLVSIDTMHKNAQKIMS